MPRQRRSGTSFPSIFRVSGRNVARSTSTRVRSRTTPPWGAPGGTAGSTQDSFRSTWNGTTTTGPTSVWAAPHVEATSAMAAVRRAARSSMTPRISCSGTRRRTTRDKTTKKRARRGLRMRASSAKVVPGRRARRRRRIGLGALQIGEIRAKRRSFAQIPSAITTTPVAAMRPPATASPQWSSHGNASRAAPARAGRTSAIIVPIVAAS